MKVLLAEDDPGSRRLVNVHLSAAGYEVIEAEDGQLAWELFQRETFQIVITDWMMPKMDGPTLIHNIRSSGQKGYTYIIMLTAIDDKPKVVMGLEAGADEYLTKPFDSKELMARVASGERILKLEEQLTQARHEMETLAMHDGLTGMFNRPQPYGQFGHNVFLVDGLAQLRLKEVALGIDVFNLLDTHWYDSEFTYSANWNPGAAARLVPERYVTVGAPRTLLATLSLFIN